jgi:hypothetical protein
MRSGHPIQLDKLQTIRYRPTDAMFEVDPCNIDRDITCAKLSVLEAAQEASLVG